MNKCDSCKKEGGSFKIIFPEGRRVQLCPECSQKRLKRKSAGFTVIGNKTGGSW